MTTGASKTSVSHQESEKLKRDADGNNSRFSQFFPPKTCEIHEKLGFFNFRTYKIVRSHEKVFKKQEKIQKLIENGRNERKIGKLGGQINFAITVIVVGPFNRMKRASLKLREIF